MTVLSRVSRIALVLAAASITAGKTPEAIAAPAIMSCQTPIFSCDIGSSGCQDFTLIFECGTSAPGGACYQGQDLQYYLLDCTTENEIGSCDGFQCWLSK